MKPWKNKLLIVVSATLVSPMAQAHDSSYSLSTLEHVFAHQIEIITANTGLLTAIAALAGLFATVFFLRIKLKTTTETHV